MYCGHLTSLSLTSLVYKGHHTEGEGEVWLLEGLQEKDWRDTEYTSKEETHGRGPWGGLEPVRRKGPEGSGLDAGGGGGMQQEEWGYQ